MKFKGKKLSILAAGAGLTFVAVPITAGFIVNANADSSPDTAQAVGAQSGSDSSTTGCVIINNIDSNRDVIRSTTTLFQVQDSNGNPVPSGTRDSGAPFYAFGTGEGISALTLPYGTNYKLVQLAAPDGYEINTTPLQFTIKSPQCINGLMFSNQVNTTGSLLVSSRIASGFPLPSSLRAQAELQKPDGTVVRTFSITNRGTLMRQIPSGDYKIVIVSNPAGYTAEITRITIHPTISNSAPADAATVTFATEQ